MIWLCYSLEKGKYELLYMLNKVGTQYVAQFSSGKAKNTRKKEIKMPENHAIETRDKFRDNEGGTTDASYPKDIFDKFPLRNWNKFLSKFFLTYFSPHIEKKPFFFYILPDCGVSAEAHGRLRF